MVGDRTKAVLAIEAALTDEQKATFLERFTERNPSYRGAHVADIIDIMDDADANIETIEPMCDAHEGEWTRLHSFAVQVACVLRWPDPARWADVDAIARKAQT